MVLEDNLFYFDEESLETQLRTCFNHDEMWDINFKPSINQMTETTEGFIIEIKGKKILIDKISGLVLNVEE